MSDWTAVTQKHTEQSAPAVGDDQWIHVDVAQTERELPGSTTIAHGPLIFGFDPVFVRSVMRLEGVTNTLNYGANRIWLPMPAGSWLRGLITIAAAEGAPRNGLRGVYGVTIEVENHECSACMAELIAMHYR